ncbi:MAG: hypothetical protein RR202_10575 [Bacteroidales bacterium]
MTLSEKTSATLEQLQENDNQRLDYYLQSLSRIAEELIMAAESPISVELSHELALSALTLKNELRSLKG